MAINRRGLFLTQIVNVEAVETGANTQQVSKILPRREPFFPPLSSSFSICTFPTCKPSYRRVVKFWYLALAVRFPKSTCYNN
jgi:hypothetical protein